MPTGATQLSAADFPGYAEAVARENLVRAGACLGMTEVVCGVECVPLTCRRVRLLAMVRSPFLLRSVTVEQLLSKPDIDLDLMAMLWICSTDFRSGDVRARDRFFKRHAALTRAPLAGLFRSALDFIAEAYLDAPEPEDGKSYYAFEVGIVVSLHRLYGLPIDFWADGQPDAAGRIRDWWRRMTGRVSPLDVPLKIYWQLQKAERAYADSKSIQSNPSDKLLADGLTAINARDRKQNEYERELMAEKQRDWQGECRFDLN